MRASRTVTYKEASHNNKLSSFEMFGTAILKAIIPTRITKSINDVVKLALYDRLTSVLAFMKYRQGQNCMS